ncbi:FAD-binding oxidoreductase [Oceanobacillus jeddahense]|uniref:FAD-binding oxidoreductase n=1 Tax=Oceanobacillus jeddahense TaxID=1462527 RepID=UPI00069474AD|nr:FAD-binding oxidoreductase [Oceanobacillus jeddahense]
MNVTKDIDILLEELSNIIDGKQIITQSGNHSTDSWPLTALQKVLGSEFEIPACVVKPRNTNEVSKVLAYLNEKKIKIVPYGAGSGVAGGAKPTSDSVVVDVSAMNNILNLDEENLTVTVQPGVYHGELEVWLNERGFISGHYPQSIHRAQIGGLVATRSSGQFSTKYGNIEDILLGLEAVLPSGKVIRLKNIIRSSTGPDLRQIWLGSEGIFGVITEITIKIIPKPAERWMHAYGIQSMRQGLKMIQQFMRDGWKPAVVRLHDAVEAVQKYPDFVQEGEAILLLLSEGPKGYAEVEGEALDILIQDQGGRPLGTGPMDHWLEHKNDVSNIEGPIEQGVMMDTTEISANWTNIADIYEKVIERLQKEVPELIVASGHSSHSYVNGTNLYFIFGAKASNDPEELERIYRSIWNRIMETTLENGGSIAHHHGIGKLRAPWMAQELGSSYELLKVIKQSIDPNATMNPGTIIPVEKK